MKATLNQVTKLVYPMLGVMMFVGVVGSGTAQAETKTSTYPGTMCQPYNPVAATKPAILAPSALR